jgi:hypothetical protein
VVVIHTSRSEPGGTFEEMSRILLLATVALAVAVGVSACGSSDNGSTATTVTASQAASKAPAADKLDAADAQVLTGAQQTVADYCDGHKASSGELTGAVATLESLNQVDPEAQNASGQTVKQVTSDLAQKLKTCGAAAASKRLTAASTSS